jgi:hypothetical protein
MKRFELEKKYYSRDKFAGVAMVSTIIVICLAAAVILWNAPFSIKPILRMAHRRWRRVLLIVLLIALGAAETHTSTPSKQTADLSNKKHWEPCKKG